MKHSAAELDSVLLDSMNAGTFTKTPETEDLTGISSVVLHYTL
jgi:hypothetical protein